MTLEQRYTTVALIHKTIEQTGITLDFLVLSFQRIQFVTMLTEIKEHKTMSLARLYQRKLT